MLLEGGWERARGKGGEIRWEVHNTWHMGKKCRVGAARGIPFENDYMTLLLPPAALAVRMPPATLKAGTRWEAGVGTAGWGVMGTES